MSSELDDLNTYDFVLYNMVNGDPIKYLYNNLRLLIISKIWFLYI